jgi:uncharacterized membrane protein
VTWLQRYRLRHYLENSIWIPPVVAMLLAMLLVRLVHALDERMGWQASFDPDNARTVLGSLAGAMFTFIVFVCSSLLLVVQLASAQLTPRLIGVLFRERVTKLTLSAFVFTFAFTLSALMRVGDTVPLATAQIAAYSCAACLGLFLYLIDHVGKLLRPSGALSSAASHAHEIIDQVYPHRFDQSRDESREGGDLPGPVRTVFSTTEGVVLAFDVAGLVALATRHHCVIELAPLVGMFVAPGSPLFRIYGGADLADERLLQSIALGAERTMEQDPAFAIRVIVDVAAKGLSPAINDPTTAVLALDQIHHLLRHLGNRSLENEHVRDAAGRVRLIYRTPDWEDLVTLAVTEIRHFGGTSIQVVRRLHAMLEDLMQTLPRERVPPLARELKLIRQSVARNFPDPEDRVLAEVSDWHGVGGQREKPSLARQVEGTTP